MKVSVDAELLKNYKIINRLLAKKDYEGCDTILDNIDVSNDPNVLLIGMLRLTSGWRSKLAAWQPLLEKVHKELITRGLDSNIILKGLV